MLYKSRHVKGAGLDLSTSGKDFGNTERIASLRKKYEGRKFTDEELYGRG